MVWNLPMKMLCIRGRLHLIHTGLYAGRVYDVDLAPFHCHARAYAQGSVFKRRVRLICKCGTHLELPPGSCVPWGPDRFVPWQPDPVKSIVYEANHLVKPTKELVEESKAST